MENNQLTHYGILGMRWGVRRTKAQLSRARGPDARRRRVTKEQYEAEKQKAINSGDASKVQAWQGKLTNAELRQAIDRCRLSKDLATIKDGEKKSGLDAVEDAMNKVGRVTNIVNTGLNAYSAVAKINNTFNSKQLPVIDGVNYKTKQSDKDKREAREAAKEAREAAKEEREARIAKDTDTINKLINDGKLKEVRDNYNTYDPAAIKAVSEAISKKDEFFKKLKEDEE